MNMSRECPDDDLIAAFVDRRLGRKERALIVEHLADCENCSTVVAETIRLQGAEAALTPRSTVTWRKLAYPAAAVLAAAACFLVIVSLPRTTVGPSRPELASLVTAVGEQRPFEPRVTGGFAYGPLQSSLRSGTGRDIPPDIRIAAAELEIKSQQQRNARLLGALGTAQLITSQSQDAVASLEKAVAHAPDDALLLSDLSAAYLVSSQLDGQSQRLTKALSAAEKATAHDSSLKEAWFNRALALERMHRNDDARSAWNDYLKVDSTSEWAAEARRHLQAIQ